MLNLLPSVDFSEALYLFMENMKHKILLLNLVWLVNLVFVKPEVKERTIKKLFDF